MLDGGQPDAAHGDSDSGFSTPPGETGGNGGNDVTGSGGMVETDAGLCIPMTCAESAATCGAISDGCGGVLTCGTCTDGTVCSVASMQCEVPEDVCNAASRSCGVLTDACGDSLACGRCEGSLVCDARAGTCGACEPRTCADDACGTFADGCGSELDCGTCQGDDVCDALSHRCATCEPTTCAEAGVSCGTISDGCGGTLDCSAELGRCPSGFVCVNFECRPPDVPTECALQMANCGAITHSCNGQAVECGACPEGEICQDNRCEACIPITCDEAGYECGTTDDGCGGTLDCGSCPAPDDSSAVPVCYSYQCCEPAACPDDACGDLPDGCGGTLKCGSCPDGEYCGLVSANVCEPCTPRTCEAGECGKVSTGDGCGGTLNCGVCPQDGVSADERNRCNTTANVCALCTLTKTVCEPGECGKFSDGCGGKLDCGGCDAGEYCGLVTAHVCTPCTPKTTCDAGECEKVSDGCGGKLDCGGCGSGERCGQVTANICDICEPRSCPASKECGTVSDGCGGTADCGTCSTGEVCTSNSCCTPKKCGDQGVGCDAVDDGCGGALNCSCSSPLVCDPSGSCCQPQTCADVCDQGPYFGPDLCGGTLSCSSCAGGLE